MKNSPQPIQPKVSICGLHDSRDSAERLLIHSVDGMKSSVIELLQTKFPANPDFRSSSIDRGDITDSNTIIRTECLDPIRRQAQPIAFSYSRTRRGPEYP